MGSPRSDANYFVDVQVPEMYSLDVGSCFLGKAHRAIAFPQPPRLEDCPTFDGTSREVAVHTYEHRTHPTYYGLVGWPTLLDHGRVGFYLMRFSAVAMCSALLASGLVTLLSVPGRRLLFTGAWLALTPAVLYLAAIINPSGLELSAAFGAWAAGIALVRSTGPPDARVVTRAAVALGALAMTRGVGPGFVALILVVLSMAAGWSRIRELWRSRAVRAATVGVLAATVAGVAWVVYVQTRFPIPSRSGKGLDSVGEEFGWWLREMVGVFGDGDVAPPTGLQIGWGVGVLVLLVLASLQARRRELLLAGAVVVASAGLIVSGHGFGFPDVGFDWQGRFVLPMLIGVPLLIAASIPVNSRVNSRVAVWGVAVTAATIGVQVWSLVYALRHYTRGWLDKSHNPVSVLFHPIWSPPVPPIVLVGLFVAGWIGLAVLLGRAAGRLDGSPTHLAGSVAPDAPRLPEWRVPQLEPRPVRRAIEKV